MTNFQNLQTQDMNLVLSTDAKPRLKWTPELHQRFVEAVHQLGGADKATPKGLMRVMGIPGLTLYHLKSHLQKFRLGKNYQHSQKSETCSESKPDDTDCEESHGIDTLNLFVEEKEINDPTQEQINENVQISKTIKIQMEVQRKLHEQIEVQRHLQLRIEAQGKYLQTVLKKAQETLSSYNCSADGVEHAKAELSQLVSMVSSSSFSGLTEVTDLSLEQKQTMRHTGYSVESSLTSSESSGRREEEKETKRENEEITTDDKGSQENCVFILPLLELDQSRTKVGPGSRKRMSNCVEQTGSKKSSCNGNGNGLRKFGVLETFDLNSSSQCENNELDFGLRQPIDLNSKE
ncbi:myb family transcription factor PHL8 isoform X2 [Spinacia oleracea]|uniref:Myb family transcription factor PHL8 isoform X2 n=2 Tax=Spinacia oleracea TaxID=3562 RepID=A0A9R0JQ47_SPIOL|nr:myb family transcription factor PHL8-like isoform X2 [Spinacia oleracea]